MYVPTYAYVFVCKHMQSKVELQKFIRKQQLIKYIDILPVAGFSEAALLLEKSEQKTTPQEAPDTSTSS